MGTKPGTKRYNGLVYTSCCIVIGLSLSGCLQTGRVNKANPIVTDDGHQRYLTQMEALIDKNDYPAAAKINNEMLELYRRSLPTNDVVLKNYIQQAEIVQDMIQLFLAREKRLSSQVHTISSLKAENAKQTTHVKALEQELDSLRPQMDRIKALEHELDTLKSQIERIKEIDLNK